MKKTSRFDQYKWFQKSAIAVLMTFMGILIYVVIIAYSRRSGNTGLDMAKIQEMRQEANSNKHITQN